MTPKLGIIAGGGDVPARLIAACRNSGRDFFVLALKGQTDPESVADVPHAWVRLGAAGKALDALHGAGVKEIVMVGAVRRPSLMSMGFDARSLRWFGKLGKTALGDNTLLEAIVRDLEVEEGFTVIAADTILGDLLVGEETLGRLTPDEQAVQDIARGVEVARLLGRADVGQAVVVQQGCVLGVEAVEGTDALLARCGDLRLNGVGGVLVKTAKPQQERRADLPTIGVLTVAGAKAAGLRGIAIEAGGALVVDREAVIAAADAAGIFLVGIAVGGPTGEAP